MEGETRQLVELKIFLAQEMYKVWLVRFICALMTLFLPVACLSIPKDDYASIQRVSLPASRISPSPSLQESPAIFEGKIVWQEKVSGYSQIFLRDLESGTQLQLTSDPFDHYRPSISDQVVVWENELEVNGKTRITIGGMDLSTMKPLVIPDPVLAHSALAPQVWGHTIVWAEQDPIFAIVELDLATLTTRVLYSGSTYVMSPDICNNIVVWEDMRDGDSDIFAHDLSSNKEFAITQKAGNQIRPRIWGDIVVWMDSRDGNYDIYGYDLKKAQEFVISKRSGDEWDPHIFDGIVVWRDSHGSDTDIFGFDIIHQIRFTVAADTDANFAPDIYGQNIVWQKVSQGYSNIVWTTFDIGK